MTYFNLHYNTITFRTLSRKKNSFLNLQNNDLLEPPHTIELKTNSNLKMGLESSNNKTHENSNKTNESQGRNYIYDKIESLERYEWGQRRGEIIWNIKRLGPRHHLQQNNSQLRRVPQGIVYNKQVIIVANPCEANIDLIRPTTSYQNHEATPFITDEQDLNENIPYNLTMPNSATVLPAIYKSNLHKEIIYNNNDIHFPDVEEQSEQSD